MLVLEFNDTQHKYQYFVKSKIPLILRSASSTYELHRISINKASTTHILYHRQDCNLSQTTIIFKSMRCYNISLPMGLLRLLLLLNVLLCAEVLRCIAVTLKKLSTLLVALRLDSRSAPNALYVSLSLWKGKNNKKLTVVISVNVTSMVYST